MTHKAAMSVENPYDNFFTLLTSTEHAGIASKTFYFI
jgi:hypothetical protein